MREEWLKKLQSLSEEEFDRQVTEAYATKYVPGSTRFIHLSSVKITEDKPRVQKVSDNGYEKRYDWSTEIMPTFRLCTSTSIEGSYYAIWGLLDDLRQAGKFKDDKYFTLHVYEVFPKRGSLYIPNETIVENQLVHDAHLTDETTFLGKVNTIEYLGECTIEMLDKDKEIYYRPFNDNHFDELLLATEFKPIKVDSSIPSKLIYRN